jgi:colanic acid/amylovoran biosynthesis glycosyltransferase
VAAGSEWEVGPERGAGAGGRRLRVAFFVTYFPKNSEVFLLNQALALLDRGHDVGVHALADPREAAVQPGTERLLADARIGRMPPATWRRLRDLPGLITRQGTGAALAALDVWRWGEEAWSLRNLYRLDAAGPGAIECDVAHAQFGGVGRQCVLLRALGRLRAPLVVSFRGNDLSGYLAGGGSGAYAEVFRDAAACLPVAERWAGQLVSLGCPRGKVQVLPSGIPMARVPAKDWSLAASPPRVVSAARLERYKGIHLGLAAVARLLPAFPGLRYEIFGDGPERPRLEARARELGLGDTVIWRGMVEHQRLLDALPGFHLHLFTTVTSPRGRTEGVPNILKETQASGLPAVAFAHPGVEEVLEDGRTGFLVPEGDVEGLAARARLLLGEATRAEGMGALARQLSRERFDLGRVTDRLEAIYLRAIRTAGGGGSA